MLLGALAVETGAGTGGPSHPGPYLFVLDLAGTPLDEFPSGVRVRNGTMSVVNKNGQHMLRASSPSELLITLPQASPLDFTVEVDLIPKSCCNPEDLMIEGTPAMNRGPTSAQLTWHPAHLMVVGGGTLYQADMLAAGPGTPRPPVLPPTGSAGRPSSAPSTTSGASAPGLPGVASGPVATATSTIRNAARCQPGAPTAPPPPRFLAFGLRVGGAPLQWINEPDTEYLLERAPAPAAGGPVTWTRLTSTCDAGAPIVARNWVDETLITYPVLALVDAFPGTQLGRAYQYRLTRIAADATSGSAIVYWEAPLAAFPDPPTASVSGNTVSIMTGVSHCPPLMLQCDPWKLDVCCSGYPTCPRGRPPLR
jgi:hypothetical protein